MNHKSPQQIAVELRKTYWYEIAEAFCKINNTGRLQHTTNEELGIDDDVGVGLEDVEAYVRALLLS
jgi:hypothetical protein